MRQPEDIIEIGIGMKIYIGKGAAINERTGVRCYQQKN